VRGGVSAQPGVDMEAAMSRSRKAVLLAMTIGAAASTVVMPAGGSVGATTRRQSVPRLQAASAVSRSPEGGIGVAAARALRDGPLPADAAALARAKQVAASASLGAPRRPVAPSAPSAARSFEGL